MPLKSLNEEKCLKNEYIQGLSVAKTILYTYCMSLVCFNNFVFSTYQLRIGDLGSSFQTINFVFNSQYTKD